MRRFMPGIVMVTLLASAAAGCARTAVVYTCPMHPEVRQSQPGSCPKCGMALQAEPHQ